MLRRFTLAASLCLATSVSAFELGNMTDEDRAIFGEQVRAYLLENPEVLQEAISVLQGREEAAQAATDVALARANADALFDDGYSFVAGNPDGDITVVEFLDYRCGFCKRAFPEIKGLIAADDNIRLVVKEFPILGEQSLLASQFAISTKLVSGDAAYSNVHDALMEFQGEITLPVLSQLGDLMGIDSEAIIAEMESDTVNEIIASNRALAQRLAISGTPTFVFEDQMVRGFIPQQQMEQLVAALRAEE